MNKQTITVRLSVDNKPVHAILKGLAKDRGITTNKLIEGILVSYVEDVKKITWIKPEKYKDNQLDLVEEIDKLSR